MRERSRSPKVGSASIRTTLAYLRRDVCEVDASDPAGRDDQDVHIESARPNQGHCATLDADGFCLMGVPGGAALASRTMEKGEQKMPKAVGQLYPKIEELVASRTGASRVMIFDHICRDLELFAAEQQAGNDHGPLLDKPLMFVHGDYTVRSGFTRAQQLLERHVEAEKLKKVLGANRFCIMNMWWPLANADSNPLALCRWASTEPRDVRTIRFIYETRAGEVYQVHHNPNHKWAYFPGMTADEGVLFKVFQSDLDTAGFSVHTALDPPSPQEAEGRPRCSIEFRMLAFWDTASDFASSFVAPHLDPTSPDALEKPRREIAPASEEW